MHTVYEAAGGTDGMLRLAIAWHARVMADEVVSHASAGPDPGGSVPDQLTDLRRDRRVAVRVEIGDLLL